MRSALVRAQSKIGILMQHRCAAVSGRAVVRLCPLVDDDYCGGIARANGCIAAPPAAQPFHSHTGHPPCVQCTGIATAMMK
jgi:hypothetical protein